MVLLGRPALTSAKRATAERVVDLLVAVPCLVVAAPLLALVALVVRLDSPGPAFFLQPRTGRFRQEFTIVKFRTMHVDNDDRAQRAQNARELSGESERFEGVSYKDRMDPRVTRVGRVLRRLSIDELPQLINVIAGQMSIVGPRPSLPWETELFPADAEDRFTVRPGITGVWQVSGRNNVSMSEMLEMDCEYARTRSVVGDLTLMLQTIPAVLRSEGAA